MSHRSEEDKSRKILSKNTLDLLNECALRWRVSPVFRWLQYLDVIRSRYDSGDPLVSLEHIKEGIHLLKEATKLQDVSTWTISEVYLFIFIAICLFVCFFI